VEGSPVSAYDKVMERLSKDRDFRALVLEDTSEALSGYELSADDRDRVLQEAEMMEAEVQLNPLEPTETDEGQADAAGVKD
jgi:hypothetical protein